MKLKTLYKIYRRWLHIEDEKRIDIVLATALTNKMIGTPIWLIIVGPSGDWKSEQILSLNGSDSYVLSRFTDKTLVTGHDDPQYDLAPQLNGKILLISDMSSILKLHPNIKGEVWAQLRDLYDGRISNKTGMMKAKREYKNIRVTMIAGSTTAIDNQILIYQELGTRELLWRTHEIEKEKLMEKVWKNEQYETTMREQINKATRQFLENKTIKKIRISGTITDYLKYKALFLTTFRATVSVDSFSGEILADVTPEEPTRILKQLKRIFIALKSLDVRYPSEKALEVIDHLIDSSSDPIRLKVYRFLLQTREYMTLSNISNELKLGKKTVLTQLYIMWNLRIVDKQEDINEWGKVVETRWTLKDNWR